MHETVMDGSAIQKIFHTELKEQQNINFLLTIIFDTIFEKNLKKSSKFIIFFLLFRFYTFTIFNLK